MSLPALYKALESEQLDAGARFASGIGSAEDAAASCGLTVDDFLSRLEDPDTLEQLEPHLAKMKSTGKLSEARAVAMLETVLINIESQLEGMSPTMALRVAEVLLKISGIQEKRAAEMKHVVPVGSGFQINIILPPPKVEPVSPRSTITVDSEAIEVSKYD
jgi:hypothetical protein